MFSYFIDIVANLFVVKIFVKGQHGNPIKSGTVFVKRGLFKNINKIVIELSIELIHKTFLCSFCFQNYYLTVSTTATQNFVKRGLFKNTNKVMIELSIELIHKIFLCSFCCQNKSSYLTVTTTASKQNTFNNKA